MLHLSTSSAVLRASPAAGPGQTSSGLSRRPVLRRRRARFGGEPDGSFACAICSRAQDWAWLWFRVRHQLRISACSCHVFTVFNSTW